MTYRGKIQNGAVVLDAPVELPDGVEVECVLVPLGNADERNESAEMSDNLMRYSGIIEGMPLDSSRYIDHYIYGHPKNA